MIAYLSTQLYSHQPNTHDIVNTPASTEPMGASMSGNVSSIMISTISQPLISCHSWVLDTGATHHICCSLDLFASSKPTQHVQVTLPTRMVVAVSHIGSIVLSTTLILHDVLYIP